MTFPMAFALLLGIATIAVTIHAIVEESMDSAMRRIMGTYFKKLRRKRLKKV